MKNLFLLFIFLISHQSFARTTEEQRTWLGLFGRKKITQHYDLWVEAQLRHDETRQTMNQTLNRFGILRNIYLNQEIGFLFAYIQTGLVKEYRPTFHHTFKKSWFENNFSIRNRLEIRDIENNESDSLRLRSQLRWSHPLIQKYNLVIWEEIFLNITNETWTGSRTFERNRAFLGTSIKLNELSFELGYMNQYVPRKELSTLEHILTFYLFFYRFFCIILLFFFLFLF